MKETTKIQMVKRKICRNGLHVSWKGEYITLIPKYHPDAKPGDYIVEEIEMPINQPCPRLIDPNETSLSVLREICEFYGVLFLSITGIGRKELEELKLDDNNVQKAIEYFIAFGTAGTTTAQYRRIFDELIRGGVIDPNLTVEQYLASTGKVESAALKFSYLDKSCDDHYNYNDKIFYMLKSFHAFLINPKILCMKKGEKKSKRYRHKRQNCLSMAEAEVFFPALKEVNPIHELIARVLWWFNREICNDPDAPIIHLESVLRMNRTDIGPDSLKEIRESLPDNVGGNCVNVSSHKRHSYKMVGYYVPGKMYAELSELARNTDWFLFRNKSGNPIDPGLVRSSFSKACKLANLRGITPNQLR